MDPSEPAMTTAHACERCARAGRLPKPGESAGKFCSAGCALRHAVPVDANGQFPANGALGLALGIGFVAFNQWLLAALAVLMAGRGDAATASKLVLASFLAGAVTWLALAVTQLRVGARRVADHAVALLAGAGFIAAWLASAPWWAAGAVAVLIVWSGRRFFAR